MQCLWSFPMCLLIFFERILQQVAPPSLRIARICQQGEDYAVLLHGPRGRATVSISNSILARLVGQDQLDRLIGDSANIVSAGLSGPLFSEPACKLQSVVRDEHDSSEESLTSTFCKGGKKKRPMKSEPTVAQHTSGKQRRGLCKEQPNKRRRTAKKKCLIRVLN